MKIRIKAEGHNIRLWLPTSMLKTRFFYRILKNGVRKNAKNAEISSEKPPLENLPDHTTSNENFAFTRAQHLAMYQTLKSAIKTNGHFNLVEVESADGEKVLIRV